MSKQTLIRLLVWAILCASAVAIGHFLNPLVAIIWLFVCFIIVTAD